MAATTTTRGVLVLLAHPDFKNSKANKALIDAIQELPDIIIEDLYSPSSDTSFNISHYRNLLPDITTIVFQFPLYWASAPSEMKRWIDEIFTPLAHEGRVTGKKLLIATTAASEYDAYRSGGRNRFTIDELLRPFEMAAHHSGMVWHTPFVIYGLREDPETAKEYAPNYRQLLLSLSQK